MRRRGRESKVLSVTTKDPYLSDCVKVAEGPSRVLHSTRRSVHPPV